MRSTVTSPARNPARLNRDAVLRAALDLLDEVGIDSLTTRRLAERLGVQSPTLYWHFKSKADLLDAMAEAIMLERHGDSLPRPGQPWRPWLMSNSRSFRNALLAYRDGARLHAGTRPREVHNDAIEAKLRTLCGAGFTPAQAVELMIALGRFIVGWVLEEQSSLRDDTTSSADDFAPQPSRHPLLARGLASVQSRSHDAAFERGVDLLLNGAQTLLRPRVR